MKNKIAFITGVASQDGAKENRLIIPVILSGGGGTRLWPLSRAQYPKQYWPLVGSNTLLQETVLRVSTDSWGWGTKSFLL